MHYLTPRQSKKLTTKDPNAEKQLMFISARTKYPDFQWPKAKTKRSRSLYDDTSCWAIADAISAAHTGLDAL
jgi:hypothetical protein